MTASVDFLINKFLFSSHPNYQYPVVSCPLPNSHAPSSRPGPAFSSEEKLCPAAPSTQVESQTQEKETEAGSGERAEGSSNRLADVKPGGQEWGGGFAQGLSFSEGPTK